MARRTTGLAVLAVLLFAAPAAASTAHSEFVPDPFGGCYGESVTTFTAGAGEHNHVTVERVSVFIGNPFPTGPCGDFSQSLTTLTDPGATIRPSGDCRFLIQQTNRAVTCPTDVLEVSLGDRDDSFALLTPLVRAKVSCGPGEDLVVGAVEAASDCETVLPG